MTKVDWIDKMFTKMRHSLRRIC